MGLKIAIIAHNCRAGGGLIATYNILSALNNVTENEAFLIVCSKGCEFEKIKFPKGSDVYIYSGNHYPAARVWFEHFTLPKVVDDFRPDMILGMGNIGLNKPKVPQAIFMRQGLLFYNKKHYPDIPYLPHLRIWALKNQVKKLLPRTGLVFCQTPVVRRRFSKEFKYPEAQMEVVKFPPPADIYEQNITAISDIIREHNNRFNVLCLTRFQSHRNPSILIPLCKKYGQILRDNNIHFITTINKTGHPKANIFLNDINKNHFQDIIANVGQLNRQQVKQYLQQSDLLWMPTLVETLGLPYLEAMVLGVPILTTDLDFAHYVCGGAAQYYDPWSFDSLFENILRIKNNPELQKLLAERGKIEIKDSNRFSQNWEETARSLLDTMKKRLLGV